MIKATTSRGKVIRNYGLEQTRQICLGKLHQIARTDQSEFTEAGSVLWELVGLSSFSWFNPKSDLVHCDSLISLEFKIKYEVPKRLLNILNYCIPWGTLYNRS